MKPRLLLLTIAAGTLLLESQAGPIPQIVVEPNTRATTASSCF
jgi:hypothetical protein